MVQLVSKAVTILQKGNKAYQGLAEVLALETLRFPVGGKRYKELLKLLKTICKSSTSTLLRNDCVRQIVELIEEAALSAKEAAKKAKN